MAILFDPYQIQLPVTEIISDVRNALSYGKNVIVSAAPGAGKSTLLPLSVLNELWLENKKIILLEPRRLAASSIAYRMADLLNEQVGQTVGYRIRFDTKISSKTRIEVVTEGILIRMLQADNALEEVGIVIFDEFHERSIDADLALVLCRETQKILRPDLRIMLMSATLDRGNLSELLDAPIIESSGKVYPVEVQYTGNYDLDKLPENCAQIIIKATKEKAGDLLVFLPGQAEIRKCETILKSCLIGFAIYPLYGQLSHSDQQEAILPSINGMRKIILATSIAETSLTIEGIQIVVDSGMARVPTFNIKSGLSGLKTSQISLDSAKQRTGRAGRLSAGTCYRMWSAATESRMELYRRPEILEADLAPLMLNLFKWGITDITSVDWPDLPQQTAVDSANQLLQSLGLIKNNKITPHGNQVQMLPCHPRLGNMLIKAKEINKLGLATDLAALLEEKDPLDSTAGADMVLRIEGLRRYRDNKKSDRRWEIIEKSAASYRKIFNVEVTNNFPDHYDCGLLISYAYPERIAVAKSNFDGQYQLANGKIAALDKTDQLAKEQWLAIAQVDARKGLGKIFTAAALNTVDLLPLAIEEDKVAWDTRKGGLQTTRDYKLGSLILKSKPLFEPNLEQIVDVISKAIETEGEALLNFNDDVLQWQNRILSLKVWNESEDWPDVNTASLLKANKEWLWPYLDKIRRTDELRKLNLTEILNQSLDYDLQLQLNQLAPDSILVPSGSQIKLLYSAFGDAPVLAVRLQEVFGMLETPKINHGKTAVVLHLLSPGYKPVQVTSDLNSFWKNTYFEIRRELKRRYPKHSWPENPLNAQAVSGAKRKTF